MCIRDRCEILEYSEAELIGKLRWQDITAPDDVEADSDMVESINRGERDHYNIWKTYHKKSMLPVRVHLSVTPIYPMAADGSTADKFEFFLSTISTTMDVSDAGGRIEVQAWPLLRRFFSDNSEFIVGSLFLLIGFTAVISGAVAALIYSS